MNSWKLPTTVVINDIEYIINSDFRDVLEVISQLNSEESEQVRLYVALALFYKDFSELPSEIWEEAACCMMEFINGGEPEDGTPAPRLLDWEQDQRMIVADINKVAGCEIRALPFVHWWTFLAWFAGIGEGQLATVVGIRSKLRRGKKLDEWEKEYYRQHKAQIDLKRRYTAEERAEQEQIKKLLGE